MAKTQGTVQRKARTYGQDLMQVQQHAEAEARGYAHLGDETKQSGRYHGDITQMTGQYAVYRDIVEITEQYAVYTPEIVNEKSADSAVEHCSLCHVQRGTNSYGTGEAWCNFGNLTTRPPQMMIMSVYCLYDGNHQITLW